MNNAETVNLCDEFGNAIVIEATEKFPLAGILCLIAVIGMLGAAFLVGENYKAWMSSENTSFGTVRVNADTVESWQPALADAVQEWRRALPGWDIRIPNLVADKDRVCNTSSEIVPIACSVKGEYKIYIARDQTLYDHKTIMMHELAHLFGVPHIEQDELMDSAYQGKLDKPTPLVIAIAEYELRHR